MGVVQKPQRSSCRENNDLRHAPIWPSDKIRGLDIVRRYHFSPDKQLEFLIATCRCMKDGCVVESGTHEELFTQDGEYAKLYNIQARAFTGEVRLLLVLLLISLRFFLADSRDSAVTKIEIRVVAIP